MFRGGPVDSRGTGITSGLMDGGRVGYNQGKLVLGGDLYQDTDYSDFIKTNFPEGRKTEGFAPALLNQMFDQDGNLKDDFTYESIFGEAKGSNVDKSGKFTGKSVYDTDLLSYADTGIPGDKSKRFTSKRPLANLPLPKPNTNNDNQEQVTEIDAKQLMRENAELFKELLGESNKKKIKDARIGDVSDYLLKFFEGSQRQGATVGSAAADVAAFATARPSKTEQAKEAIEKQDQTAMALAINDYIAGKRSKEQLDMLSKKLDINLKNKFAAIDYTAEVADAAKKGKSLTTLIEESDKGTSLANIRSGSKIFADAQGLNPPRSFISKDVEGSDLNLVSDTNELLVEENKGQIFIDEATKEVFIVVEDPNNPGNFIKRELYR
jgi:hypothetical protein